jgi:transposase
MIQLTPQMRILLAKEPVDFRKGIDGLCGICRQVLKTDPFNGTVFVFRNSRASALKILLYDGQGFWLCQKRLSKGRFCYYPKNVERLAVHELMLLFWNGNPEAVRVPFFKEIKF